MYKKYYFTLGLIVMMIAAGGLAVSGQTVPLSGEVHIKKADGTIVPVANAAVDVYRTDIDKGKMPSAKTNKKGQFNFVGLVLGQTYAIAVSGEGIQRDYLSGVKAGADNIAIEVREGDGKTWTEEELRTSVKNTATTQPGGQLTAEQKKQQADYEKQVADVNAKNKKMQEGDAVARKSSEEGNAALRASNFDLAITKYDEGIAAVPDYVGSTPILLDGKLAALKGRGYNSYREGAASTDASVKLAKYDLAKKDYSAALDAYSQARQVIKSAPAATDP
ncbi:MAG: hypothetical protein ACRD43_09215, partial [Pyrinomonadaceae bacterium]